MLSNLAQRHAQTYTSWIMLVVCIFASGTSQAFAQKRRAPGGRLAVVVDERLAALRDAPDLGAPVVRRLGRGRVVTINQVKRLSDGIMFYRVAVTRRTRGWLPAESVVQATRAGDDERLLRLIRAAEDFDRLARSRIFLDTFPASALRPTVLQLYAEAAEASAEKLSREAARRFDNPAMPAGGAPVKIYYLNYNGLDRFTRQGVRFVFDETTRQLHYDGQAWREIVRRYPHSAEAVEARRRLAARPAFAAR